MDSITLELLTRFDNPDIFKSFDIAELKLRVTIKAEDNAFSKITFHIVLSEPYIDDELEQSADCLISPESSEQQAYIDQQVDYPIKVIAIREFMLNILLASTRHGSPNFLDTLKCFPDYVLDNEEHLELYIKAILTDENGYEIDNRIIVNVRNPWFNKKK
jgi:hypothetical protein